MAVELTPVLFSEIIVRFLVCLSLLSFLSTRSTDSSPSPSQLSMTEAAGTPKSFKAWQYTTSGKPSEVLKLTNDYSLPPVPGFPIVVKVHAAALNPVGYKVISDMPSLVTKKPGVPEQDYSGVVAGGDLSGTSLKVGDEVFGTIPVS